jgi:hypothetical protein
MRVIALTFVLLAVSSCGSFGPRQVPGDQFDYNRAIARSMQEQMLLNIVRLRFFEAPVFLAVSSVLTQYVWQGSIGVSGQEGFSIGGGLQAPSLVGGAATAQYSERPTITYLPIEGDDFSRRMLTPMPLDFVFALQEAGYATDLLFRAGIHQINEVRNLNVSGVPAPGDLDRKLQEQREIENLKRFRHLLNLMSRLYLYNAIEVQRRGENDSKERFLVISPQQDPQVTELIAELKRTLGLDPTKTLFRITDRRVGRATDEITIRTRSLFQIMGFLAHGVSLPPEQQEQSRAIGGETLAADEGDNKGVPFRVRWTAQRPRDAFVAVEYNGYWYSIASTDIESKRAFNLLVYGFRLLAPERATAAPALTLPTGP